MTVLEGWCGPGADCADWQVIFIPSLHMSEIQKQLSAARASVDPKGAAAPHARAAQVRFPRDEEASDEAAIDTTGEVVPQESTGDRVDPGVVANAESTPGALAGTGAESKAGSAADEQADRHDRSSALLAAGLGLLGVGGAASLGGVASTSGSKPAGLIDPPKIDPPRSDPPKTDQPPSDPPKTDQPRSDPPVTEQKPGPGTSQPTQPGGDPVSTPDQPKPDEPKPDQPKPDEPKPDPVKPGTDPALPEDPPAKPAHVPDAPTLALQKDTGSDDHDRITSSGVVNVSGLEAGASVAVSLDDGKTWTSGLASTLPESLFGEDGVKHLLVKQIDAQGHDGAVARLDFQLDRTAPAAPSWTMPANKPALGPADVMALRGVETGALVEYRLDAGSPWQVAQGGLVPASIFHADGTGRVEVRQTDLAGNVGPVATLVVPVDVTAPAAPLLELLYDTGANDRDGITSSSSVGVRGLEEGARLLVSVDGSSWAEIAGTVPSIAGELVRGAIDLDDPAQSRGFFGMEAVAVSVKQVDGAGNASEATTLRFTLDREAVNAGWSTSGKQQGGGAETEVALNARDWFQVERFSGQRSVLDTLAYRIDGGAWKDVANGARLPLNEFGADGKHQLELRETDLAGNVGIRAVEVTLDLTIPEAAKLSLKNDDGASATDKVTSDPTVALNGLQPGDTFMYRINDGDWMPGWKWAPGTVIRDVDTLGHAGSNTVEVYVVDAAGNFGPATQLTFQYTPPPSHVI